MDLGLADDKVESFRLFQKRIMEAYDRMSEEYNLTVVNGTLPIQEQQKQIRMLVRKVLYGWEGLPNPFAAAGKSRKKAGKSGRSEQQ
ncbi:MAG: hypothetical protein HY835_02520 [Anaerolineae bacterium]|nr:hypothetical protein [Anaerolineae bacterium]